jgi:hypothetical protein
VAFLSRCIEEGILNVLLRRLGFHLPISFFLSESMLHRQLLERQSAAARLPVGSYNTALSRAFQLLPE